MIQSIDAITHQQEEVPDLVVPALRDAILHLLDSLELARDAQRSAWDFSLEIASLQQLGVHSSQLRWLVCKEYVEHNRETTKTSASKRTFEPTGSLSFTPASCFVLTGLGEDLGRLLRPDSNENALKDSTDSSLNPIWDADLRELRFESQVVKRYKVPSPNQQMLLSAFDEEDWPCRIDDPLPPHPEIDPKRRLHDTIKSLNRHQLVSLLRFYGDGTGEGVRWGVVK